MRSVLCDLICWRSVVYVDASTRDHTTTPPATAVFFHAGFATSSIRRTYRSAFVDVDISLKRTHCMVRVFRGSLLRSCQCRVY